MIDIQPKICWNCQLGR